jgi:thiol-disulfide isomerase/thioredoxin
MNWLFRLALRAACCVFMLMGLSAQAQHMVKPWPVNQASPAVSLVDMTGKPVRLADYKGKTVVLNFWATWCEPCRSEMPSLAQLQEISGPDVIVLAANFKEGVARIEQFAKSSGIQMNWLRDPEGHAAKAFDVRIFPSTLIIDKSGRPLRKIIGEVDWTGKDAEALLKP